MRFPRSSLLLCLCLLLLSILSSCPTSAQSQCLDDQKSSLLTLFGSSQPPSWTPNYAKEVTCDNSTGHVIGLDLTNHSIRTPINSASLISLSSLRILNLSLNFFNSSIPPSLGALSNLTHLNLSNSGFTGHVPVEISRIKSLESVDLSSSGFSNRSSLSFLGPDFGYVVGNLSGLRELYLDGMNISSPAPESLAGLVNLTSLHLSSCNLNGEFPLKVFQLSNLETLDLSSNLRLSGTVPEFPLESRLRILSLSGTNFSGKFPDFLGKLRYLQRLELHGCKFLGRIPSSLRAVSQLSHLDISSNSFEGEIPPLENLTQLVHLDLSLNRFTGKIPLLENLTKLVWLDLSSNMLSGRIPSLGSLKNVETIVLSNNNFSGAIDSSYAKDLSSLKRLDLRNNSLSGKIPSSLFTLPSLQYLDFSQNQFNASLDEFGIASSSLNSLDLSNNKLQGPIPKSVFQLIGLKVFLLSSNSFSGIVDLSKIQNLKKLSSLDLSNNNLSIINARGIDNSFPQLTNLRLSSCNLTKFPDFIKNQIKLSILDLSNNKIRGEIPSWIWKMGNGSLKYLNLSHNMVDSLELPTVDLSSSKLRILDLHANNLQGSMPIPPPSIVILDYSRNNFTSVIPTNISLYLNFTIFFSLSENNISGEIPPSICNATNLIVFDLSNNNLSGLIPNCLGELKNLRVLNLGKNGLRGVIPQTFVHGCSLGTLNLNRNQLEGSLPGSLASCMQLKILNIGNNQIKDSFPSWLGSLKQLRVLILRANNFYGPILRPEDPNAFSQLQIIDIAWNNFTGNLPSEFFQNLKAMMDGEVEHQSLRFEFLDIRPRYYQDSVMVTLKGLEMKFLNTLSILKSIDLSKNRFLGSIHEEIGNLKSLHVLNMSNNEFTGSIPSSFGNLSQVESLDLSMNQLTGEIPRALTALTFLSVLNLSENHLVGSIPQVNQFSTFGNDSFEGNPGLCGPPLTMNCSSPSSPPPEGFQTRKEFNWQFIWLGLGFGVGNGMVFTPLVYWKKGRRWYNKHVDRMLFMVMPTCAWFLFDCDGEKLEEEESEQELMEFTSDMEEKEEGEPFLRRFCVFCTQIDMGWKRAMHRECSCPDSSPLCSSPGSQNTEDAVD